VKPLAALTPRPVPLVLHAVDVAPVGSIRSCGLVVVDVPPEYQVPVSETGGPEATPVAVLIKRPDWVILPSPSITNVFEPANAPALLYKNCPLEPATRATVPVASGNEMVRFAVGVTICSVVL
jgi:hypothetical protein